MTARELYEYALIELNKLEAPSLLLEDYNYFINKAVQQYINLVYAKFEIDQQSTDDLRVLKASTALDPKTGSAVTNPNLPSNYGSLFGKSYYVDLPYDYLHLLNCIIEYTVQDTNFKCYNRGEAVHFAARRISSDMYTQIINNAYLRPMYKRPYYFISNINSADNIVTNPHMDGEVLNYAGGSGATVSQISEYYQALIAYNETMADPESTDADKTRAKQILDEKRNIVTAHDSSLIDSQNEQGDRLANASKVRLELRFGSDDTVFKPTKVYIDYIKAPMYIRLTQEQINSTLDYSQILEFPDYVCFEIVNIFTRLLMENASDPRLQTNMPINNTIANPILQQQAAQQQS